MHILNFWLKLKLFSNKIIFFLNSFNRPDWRLFVRKTAIMQTNKNVIKTLLSRNKQSNKLQKIFFFKMNSTYFSHTIKIMLSKVLLILWLK